MLEIRPHINNLHYLNGLQWTAARHSSISLLLVTATKPEFQSKIVKLLWCTYYSVLSSLVLMMMRVMAWPNTISQHCALWWVSEDGPTFFLLKKYTVCLTLNFSARFSIQVDFTRVDVRMYQKKCFQLSNFTIAACCIGSGAKF